MLSHFDNVYSLDIPDKPETFYHTGYAFGSFLKGMVGMDVKDIKEGTPISKIPKTATGIWKHPF